MVLYVFVMNFTNKSQWLHAEGLMPTLLGFLSSEHSWATQTSAGDFLKAIITISANASQNEQSCIGPNALTRQLVSQECIEKLISDMLKGGNPLTVGVGIVIEVIRKNNSDYDPDVGAEPNAVPSSKDPIYLGTLLRMFAQRVPDFMDLILSPNHTVGGGDGPVSIKRKELSAAFGGKIEPLGFDRFKTCELMAELLHCSNMGLLNEIGSEEFVKARDAERERLKAEGKLGVPDTPPSPDDGLMMKSSTQTRLGSPDGSRKLEIANATEDDGFEEVSRDVGDEAKDEFEDRPEDFMITKTESDDAPEKPSRTLSFLDKDDDDFVDEPLTSPRLHTIELAPSNQSDVMEMTPLPLSPTKELANQIESLDIQQEDTPMTSPPPSVDAHAEDAEEPTSEPNKIERGSPEEESAPAPPQLIEEKSGEPALSQLVLAPEALDSLPHPEDKPAPLFAKKSEPVEEPASTDGAAEQNVSSESLDTTMGEAGDLSNSIVMGNTEEQQQVIVDDAVTPVVGDFLKMQFVEHKVVPTILVSQISEELLCTANPSRISSSDSLGITFSIMLSTTSYNKSLMALWIVVSIARFLSISLKPATSRCELSMDKRRAMKHKRRIGCVSVIWAT
jgi:SIT4-associating protein SAP185/190